MFQSRSFSRRCTATPRYRSGMNCTRPSWIAASVDKEAEFSDEEDELAYAADPDDADF